MPPTAEPAPIGLPGNAVPPGLACDDVCSGEADEPCLAGALGLSRVAGALLLGTGVAVCHRIHQGSGRRRSGSGCPLSRAAIAASTAAFQIAASALMLMAARGLILSASVP